MDTEKPRILLLEDDAGLSLMYVTVLRHAGYAVQASCTGAEALAHYQRFRPHLVLVDIELPGRMDGFAVIQELRKRGDTRIIVVSGRSANEDRIRGLEIGSDNYLTKPVAPDVLLRYVAAELRRSLMGDFVDTPTGVVDFPEASIDFAHSEVRRHADGKPAQLNGVERKLLWRLLKTPGDPVPHRELLFAGWGLDPYQPLDPMSVTMLDSAVYRLRVKLGDKTGRGGERLLFKQVAGGYGIRRPVCAGEVGAAACGGRAWAVRTMNASRFLCTVVMSVHDISH